MFHVVVCDDEKIFREELTAWLQRYQEENQVSFCIKEFHEGKELADHMPSQMDILFLDIKMKTMDGIKVAETVRALNEGVSIIFLTAVAEYALEGYDVEAVSYLIKPVEKERLFACLDRAFQRCGLEAPALLLDTPGGTARVRVRDICYLESDAHDTWVHCAGGKGPVRCRVGIRQLEERLERQGGFFKIHRSYLVNLAYVEGYSRAEVTLANGDKLNLSKYKYDGFVKAHLRFIRSST